ncbi:MAG: alpha/beta hydrolase [Promethearchaeota archaeon]
MFIDNPLVSNVVFYPRKIPEIEILKFQINPDIKIGGFLFLKSKNLPTILLFHGNGEIALEYINFANFYFEMGANLAVIDYRGYGFSSGEPYYTCLISDAMPIFESFLEWADNYGLNSSIFIKGRSLGSVCASEIGAHNPERVNGIIFESGFGSIYNIMTKLFGVSSSKITPESVKEFSNDIRMQKILKPILIIHGTADNIIPHEEANLIYNAIQENVEKKIVLIEGAGHNNISSYKRDLYFKTIQEFIESYK